MTGLTNPDKEGIERELIKDINQLELSALVEGAAVCVGCGQNLREGDALIAYAFRPVEQTTYDIGHLKCTEDRHEPTEHFTLGINELVVEGRVGICRDQATQSSWPVLLAPRPRVVSPPDTTDAHPLPGTAWTRRRIEASDTYTAADACTTRKPWQRAVRRSDAASADLDASTEPGPDPSTPRADGGLCCDPADGPVDRGQTRWSIDD